MPIPQLSRPTTCTFLFIVTVCTVAFADDVLTVKLASGRTFTGDVDDRTNANKLWLRYGTDGITILRPINWNRVIGATYQDQRVPLNELRQLASEIKSKEERKSLPARPAESNGSSTNHARAGRSYAERAREALAAAPRVRSVEVDSFLANWDADVAADGLIVRVSPMAASGELSNVNGTLHVELIALKSQRFQDSPRARGAAPVRIGTWVRRFSADEITANGLEVKLPFQAVHPEFDTTVDTHGLVHIRVVAPGHGVFEHSQDAVRIRTYSPLRDHRQQNGRERFLSSEMAGRSR